MKRKRGRQLREPGLGLLFRCVRSVSLMVCWFHGSHRLQGWSRFCWRWYAALLQDEGLIAAAWLSLRVALLTAFASVIIGTWAGFVLARMGRFRGFTLYTGMINAPLVIPEVIQGISLLLLFIEMAKWF